MKNSEACNIEKTIIALQEAINNRKMQMHQAQIQSGPSSILSNLVSEISNRAGGSCEQMSDALEHGKGLAQEFLKKAQQSIQERPWEILRKVAVYSFAIGLFLRLRHKKLSVGEKE